MERISKMPFEDIMKEMDNWNNLLKTVRLMH